MKSRRWVSAAFTCLVGVGMARSAFAQAQGFAVDSFDPSERGSDWFSVESLDLRGHLRPAIGVVMDGAVAPLVLYSNGQAQQSLIQDQVFAHVGGSLVLWDRLRVGLSLPVALLEDGSDGAVGGVTFAAPSGFSVGDLRMGADVRLAGAYGDPFTLALGARVYIPSGQRDNYTGDGTVRVDGRVEIAGDLGAFTYAARAGSEYRGIDGTLGGNPLGSQVLFGAAAGVRLLDRALVVGPEVYGATALTGGAAFATASTPVDALFGAHFTIHRDFRIGAGGGLGLTRGLGSPEARWMATLEWAPAIKPPPPPPPPPPPDRDKDGIVDAVDACPDTAGVKTDDPKTNGCPSDRDKDGIIDAEDACPDRPGVKTADPKTNGCPPDKDQDGVVDAEDACPDTPGIRTDDPKTNGCPSDRDKDGIVDIQDACPDQPGPANADPKENGCPKAY
ncbi:MAG: thrombospondin type 3 repeat-containing protein, partial [Polyangiaceae bacterium]